MTRIRWTELAAADLARACEYIEQNGTPEAARRVAVAVLTSIGSLQSFPFRGRPGRRPDTRELIIPRLPYIAVYRIHDDIVEILRIFHGAQEWL